MISFSSLSKFAFAGFAILLAGRDVLSELFLEEEPIALAFLNCLVITSLSGLILLVTGQFSSLLKKLQSPKVGFRALVLGICASIVYGVTFYMLKAIGAGLFDLIDYGLAPLITATIGAIYFQDQIRLEFFLSFFLYFTGILLLQINKPMSGWELTLIALASPLTTAISDGLTKWLLAPQGGNLTRSQLLFIRFLPASLLLFILSLFNSKGLHFHHLGKALPITVIFGFGPLWLLCTSLGRKGLTELAMWEFIIPGLAFFGTLPAHLEEHGQPLPILGACLVISALLVGESRILTQFLEERSAEHKKLNLP